MRYVGVPAVLCAGLVLLLSACSGGTGAGLAARPPGGGRASASAASSSGPTELPTTTVDPGTTQNGITTSWLESMQRRLQPRTIAPLVFSPLLAEDSYDNWGSPGVTPATIADEEGGLIATGAQAITIDMGFDPWLSHDQAAMAEDSAAVARIRAAGDLVVLKDASAERYRRFPLPWNEFVAAWINRVRTIAALYHPDYYTVIKEPPWYWPMIAGLSLNLSSPADRQVGNVSNWIALLQQLVAAVHSVSPSTHVGVAVTADPLFGSKISARFDLPFLQQASRVPGVAFLGFDIYTASAFAQTERYLTEYGSNGRAVWINEAWSTTSPQSAFNPSRAGLDVQWMKVLYAFAETIHAAGVSPFFTDCFFSYRQPPTTTQGLLSYYKGREPVWSTLRRMVSENKALTAPWL